MECPVCLETKSSYVTTICGHTFCTACVGQVVMTTLKCPMCRGLLMDEPVSCKVLNESIKHTLRTFTKGKKRLFWHEYHLIHARVDEGEITEDDIETKLIEVLTRMGASAQLYIKQEMLEAVVHRDDYLKAPYEDWRLQFHDA